MRFGLIIISIISICLSVLSIVGLVFLTQFSFYGKIDKKDGKLKINDVSKTKVIFAQITVVLCWISLAVNFIAMFFMFGAPVANSSPVDMTFV